MKYILKSPMLCICALYSKRQQIKFFEKIFDRCTCSLPTPPPTSFKIIASPRQRKSPLKKSPKWTNLQKPPESLEFEKW